MSSCQKRVYRRMCEHPDGTRTGRYKKNEYYSVPKDASKKASGTKKASKPTKTAKSKAKSVRKPVSAKITKESNVRAWYVKTYPTDDLGKDINPKLTFRTVASSLHFGSDIYDVIGVDDSLIRERIFEKIASLYKVSYGEVYDTWLDQRRKFA